MQYKYSYKIVLKMVATVILFHYFILLQQFSQIGLKI